MATKKTKVVASEASVLKYHLAVLNDELLDDDGNSMIMGDTAKSQSSRAVERILQMQDERAKRYLHRRDVQQTLSALATLVRDRILQQVQQGTLDSDIAQSLLTELHSESTRLFSKMVDDE